MALRGEAVESLSTVEGCLIMKQLSHGFIIPPHPARSLLTDGAAELGPSGSIGLHIYVCTQADSIVELRSFLHRDFQVLPWMHFPSIPSAIKASRCLRSLGG